MTYTKTIYNSNLLSDSEYLKMGREAANSALQANGGVMPREWVGRTLDGVTIRGYSDNGVVSSFFPEVN
ncbi:hypothetical protein ACFOMH_17380 [Paracoccus mangrovi]|uniref:Bacterial EndoU nuclease domain-containing protein n=1 Tax=Paracoccus mangrovi TaxID=1715645 RepID=A0ABV7R7H0_9RHOB